MPRPECLSTSFRACRVPGETCALLLHGHMEQPGLTPTVTMVLRCVQVHGDEMRRGEASRQNNRKQPGENRDCVKRRNSSPKNGILSKKWEDSYLENN